jgi:voltage-gated potassium channel
VLKQAGVERARVAILLADQSTPRTDQDRDARSILTALMVERINPRIRTCVELLNSANEAHIRQMGIENVIVPTEWGAYLMSSLVEHEALATAFEELLDRNRGNSFYLAAVPEDLVGTRFGEAAATLKRRHDWTPIGLQEAVLPPGGGAAGERVVLNPPFDRVLAASDQLIVIALHPPGQSAQADGAG